MLDDDLSRALPLIRTGIDICDVREVWRKLRRSPGLREDVFSPREIAYCERFPDPAPHYAARFAAKEAFAKAVGLDLLTLDLAQIEVQHGEGGRPHLALLDANIRERAKVSLGAVQLSFDVSISHEADYAVASVVILAVVAS